MFTYMFQLLSTLFSSLEFNSYLTALNLIINISILLRLFIDMT